MVVRVPVGGGIHAPELHSDSPEAIYAHTPGLKVVMPSSAYDAKGLLLAAIRDPDPVVFFEPKRVYRSFREQIPEGDYTVPIGVAKVLAEGTDLTVISWGAPVHDCLKVLDKLPEDVSVELIDLRTIYPLDTDTIVQSVQKTGRCVIVCEAPKTASMASEIATIIQEQCFLHLRAPVQRVTGFDTVMPYYKLELEYIPNPERIAEAVTQCLAY
jgi:pyruvate dehydrogenase E1 component beta subunit